MNSIRIRQLEKILWRTIRLENRIKRKIFQLPEFFIILIAFVFDAAAAAAVLFASSIELTTTKAFAQTIERRNVWHLVISVHYVDYLVKWMTCLCQNSIRLLTCRWQTKVSELLLCHDLCVFSSDHLLFERLSEKTSNDRVNEKEDEDEDEDEEKEKGERRSEEKECVVCGYPTKNSRWKERTTRHPSVLS